MQAELLQSVFLAVPAVRRRRVVDQSAAFDVAAAERTLAVTPGCEPAQRCRDLPELGLCATPGSGALGAGVRRHGFQGRAELIAFAFEACTDVDAVLPSERLEDPGLVLPIISHAEPIPRARVPRQVPLYNRASREYTSNDGAVR
jgi:hypothetical protein